MTVEEEIFKRSHVDFQKLEEYGFIKNKDSYQYESMLLDNQFKVLITINIKGKISSKIIDLETEEEYLNLRTNSTGEFVNKVRSSYEELLKDIQKNCFVTEYFSSNQANIMFNQLFYGILLLMQVYLK